jgi:S-formylglutathione hydrolase FrmB
MSARRLASWIALAAAGFAVAAAAPARAACSPPRCQDVVVPLPAGVSVPDATVRILLPAGYDAGDPSTRYPVLYLLHGAGDTFATWTQNTDVEAFSAAFPLIIAMPDGGHGGAPPNEAGWYSDWQDGSRQWETFHTQVLVDYVDATFHTLGAGHRAVAGLSMGGFGAMSYAARHPGLFEAAASFSGAVDTQYVAPASGFFFANLQDAFGTPGPGVWGDQLADEPTWSAHNPRARAADLACTELFVATGTGTPGGPAGDDPNNPGGYALESFIFQMNLSFAAALTQAGVPFHQDFYAGGYHGWPYWQRELHWALPQILPVIAADGTGGPCAAAAAQPLRVMTYNVLHGQPCNGGSYGSEVKGRMEFAVQGGPNREPGLVELAPDILGMQEVSQVFRAQSIGSDPTQDNLVCLAGSPPPGLTEITPYEHQADTLLRRMNGVANMRGVEAGTATSVAPTSASPYAMRFLRDNPRVLPFVPELPIGADAQTTSDFAAEMGNIELGLVTLSRFPIQRMTVHNLSFGEVPGETRALTHATIRVPDAVTGEKKGYDFYVSHLTTTGGDSPQTVTMATNILSFIAANRRHPENPAFFVCDCNAAPASTVHGLFEAAGFVDSFARAHPGADGFTSGRDSLTRACGQVANERIDYVWAIPDDQGRTPAVLGSDVVMSYYRHVNASTCLWPSDHNGVLSTFDLQNLQSAPGGP